MHAITAVQLARNCGTWQIKLPMKQKQPLICIPDSDLPTRPVVGSRSVPALLSKLHEARKGIIQSQLRTVSPTHSSCAAPQKLLSQQLAHFWPFRMTTNPATRRAKLIFCSFYGPRDDDWHPKRIGRLPIYVAPWSSQLCVFMCSLALYHHFAHAPQNFQSACER